MSTESITSIVKDCDYEGAWMVSIPFRVRLLRFAFRMGIASAVAAWLFYLHQRDNVSESYFLWEFGTLVVGAFLGFRAFGIKDKYVFETVVIGYSVRERVKRAAKYFFTGVTMLVIIWWVQFSQDQFSTYWWYAWPALLPLLVSAGLFLLKSERVLSSKGQDARSRIEAAQALAKNERRNYWLNSVAEFFEIGFVRYVCAIACLCIAYWFAFESTGKREAFFALGFVLVASYLARELAVWLLGFGALVLIGWGIFAGMAALPVSVAVIVGALIIASAGNKK